MPRDLLYLDSSALVKLVLPEPESQALLASLESWPARVTSEVSRVEVIRAARRSASDPAVERRAEEVLAALNLLKLDDDILDRAARLEPRTLRALDALHLATALSLGDNLGAMVVYDLALAATASAHGIEVMAPGAELSF